MINAVPQSEDIVYRTRESTALNNKEYHCEEYSNTVVFSNELFAVINIGSRLQFLSQEFSIIYIPLTDYTLSI